MDGREKSADELRHEVAELDEEHRRRADEMRAEVGGTVEELASRLARAGRAGPGVAAVLGAVLVLLLVRRRRRRRPR